MHVNLLMNIKIKCIYIDHTFTYLEVAVGKPQVVEGQDNYQVGVVLQGTQPLNF